MIRGEADTDTQYSRYIHFRVSDWAYSPETVSVRIAALPSIQHFDAQSRNGLRFFQT